MKGIGDAVQAGADKTTAATKQSTSALAGLGEALTATFIADMGKKILDNAESIVKMSNNLGVGTDALQAFQYATREAGGTTENANKIFEISRAKLDELRAGNSAATAAFAALGLSASDFIGLSLDQALEKIAQGYDQNADRAGAYAALQVIVGKGGRDTMQALQELGENGFGALISKATEAHAVISGGILVDLTESAKRLEEFKNAAMVGGSYIADIFGKIGATVGAVAGSFWELGKAFASGGPFTASGRQALKDAQSAYSEVFDTIWTGSQKTATATDTTKKNIEGALPSLVTSSALTQERAKFEDLLTKAAEEGLDTQSKIALIRADIAKHYAAAAAAGADEEAMQKEMNKAAEDAVQIRVLLAKLRDDELKTAGLLLSSDQTTVQIATLHLQLLTGQTDTIKIQAEQKQLLARAGVDLTVDEKVRLDVLTSQLTATQKQQEVSDILKNGVNNLTAADKVRLAVLDGQTTKTDTQAKSQKDITDFQKMALALSPDQLDAEDKMVQTAILEAKARGQNTDELTKQLALLGAIIAKQQAVKTQVDSLIDQWEGYQIAVTGHGDYTSMSTAMLQGIVTKENAVKQAQMEQNQKDPLAGQSMFGGISSDPYNGVPGTDLANLAGAQQELAQRTQIQNYIKMYGQSAAQSQFGDQATSTAMSNMATTSAQTSAAVIQINQTLTKMVGG